MLIWVGIFYFMRINTKNLKLALLELFCDEKYRQYWMKYPTHMDDYYNIFARNEFNTLVDQYYIVSRFLTNWAIDSYDLNKLKVSEKIPERFDFEFTRNRSKYLFRISPHINEIGVEVYSSIIKFIVGLNNYMNVDKSLYSTFNKKYIKEIEKSQIKNKSLYIKILKAYNEMFIRRNKKKVHWKN